jgi:hypothetical protein
LFDAGVGGLRGVFNAHVGELIDVRHSQKLGIIPTWTTDNMVTVPQGVAALVKASAPALAIEKHLVQLDGFSWSAAQAQVAAGYPITAGL